MNPADERRSSGAPLLGRDATVDGGTAALLMATVATLLMGAGSGSIAGMAAGVGGAIATVVGIIRVADADPISRAVGSVALLVGAVFLIRGLTIPNGTAGFVVVGCGSVGVLAVTAETLPAERLPSLRPALYSLLGSAGIFLVAGAVLLILTPFLGSVRAAPIIANVRGGLISDVLPSLVILQVLIVVLSLTIDRAKDVLEGWLTSDRTDGFSILDQLGVEPGEIPRTLWAFLGAQAVLALLFSGVVTAIFRATPPGEVLYVTLTGGVVHLLVVGLIVPFAGVVAFEGLRHLTIRSAGYHPPTVIGLLAGGLIVTAGAFGAAVLSGLGIEVTWAAGVVDGLELIGFASASKAILSMAGGMAVFALCLVVGGGYARHTIAPHVRGVPAGTVLLFVAAVVGSETGVHPVMLFVIVGLTLGALETGSRSSRLSRRLGPSVDARSAELVHVLGSAIAIAVGIGLATVALYLVVPAAVGLGDARGVVLLLAGLVGLLGAVLLFGRESPTAEG